MHLHINFKFTKILNKVVSEGIIVVDHQQHLYTLVKNAEVTGTQSSLRDLKLINNSFYPVL